MFCKADIREAQVISTCLQRYGSWSGQRLNVRKSSITFSQNICPRIGQEVCDILLLPCKDNVEKHMGLPVSISKNKCSQFKVICERVKHRLEGWQMRSLSQARRLVLIKLVTSAIPVYSMAQFLLPKAISDRLDGMRKRF